ncbi:MAG: SRPBCC family protein [Acidobacteriota bacterium]|nr:SRPBCC family protein [Acidobacteriota bacterium]
MSDHIYQLRQEQFIPRPISEVFAFFSDAHNLETITPPWLSFKILSMSSPSIQKGTHIRYQLRLQGIPLRWLTEISEWNPPYQFVDEQLSGPYKLWHHTHTFEDHGDGTLMKDAVRYQLPFGVLGRIVHVLKVRRDVEQIIAFRRDLIARYFGAAV